MTKRRCSRCGEDKDISAFDLRSKETQKLSAWCRLCKSEWFGNWWIKNRESVLEKRRLKRQGKRIDR